jgi:hypothetical protein
VAADARALVEHEGLLGHAPILAARELRYQSELEAYDANLES